ncbi:thioredoxin-disulfide reductase [Endomicrobium proavitum]|uniref:Thioredoxin reductase n=1 Tax=Endomicrobium proavitum TaxID=1408281 RepID=A0A0G3WJJ5_9BACT|nr:thioredoxin-disulfide reductase [Endomicrobium proavitum]AKL98050.1 Thioredoxin reductase [Endomicrobium proavitum]
MDKIIYDAIIIGGGPAGMTAAIYTARARLNTLLIEKSGCGGQMAVTDLLENYPGFNGGINGFELGTKLEAQVKDFGAQIVYDEVESISEGNIKTVKTPNAAYQAKTVIIAAGTKVKNLGVKGEEKFIGNGISFCAVCDAPFYKNKDVLVVGGGDSAVQEAIYLAKFAKNVTIIHRRDELRAAKILRERMLSYKNISVMYNTVADNITGSEKIEKVTVSNVKTKEQKDLKVDGIFVFVGLLPNTTFSSNVALDALGYIITDENMKTSIPGIFAAGDIRKKQLRQVVTAASDGAQAAISAQHYIEENEKLFI